MSELRVNASMVGKGMVTVNPRALAPSNLKK